MDNNNNNNSNSNAKDSGNFTKLLIIIALVVLVVSLYFLMLSPSTKKPASRGSIRSEEQHREQAQQYADIGGEFVLIDQDGKEFSSAALLGRPALVYFGFTFCPDICPTSLQKITAVMKTLDQYQIDVTPIFITIDPARDNAELLKLYLTNFHSKLIALTGTEQQVKKAADLFKVYYEIAEGSDKGRNDYLVNHTSFIYLMDKNFHYVKHFDMSTSSEEIIEFIRINFK